MWRENHPGHTEDSSRNVSKCTDICLINVLLKCFLMCRIYYAYYAIFVGMRCVFF